MTVSEVASELVALVREQKFSEAEARFYADDIVSVEAQGPDPVATGLAAVKAKGEWWEANMIVNSIEVSDPYVCHEEFAVRMSMNVTEKASGKQIDMDEIAVYTVRDGKIVHEKFFY